MIYILALISFFGSLYITKVFQKIAVKYGILDHPNTRPDKIQKESIPLLGGLGFSLVCSLLTLLVSPNLVWVIFAIHILIIGGFIDDKYTLSSKWVLSYILFATFIAVSLGSLKIDALSYPFDLISLKIGFLPQVLAFIWIILCTASTKFLDGHDGIVASVGVICLLNIASIALLPNVDQVGILQIAIIWTSGIISFLFYNFPNAKMYLGEGGSEIIGFVIGVLSIISGAKIATSGVVVGWFVFDIMLVFLIRVINKKPIFQADSNHWHHRLRKIGLTKIQILIFTVILILISTHVGMLFGTGYKVIGIAVQPVVIILVYLFWSRKN